MTGNEIVVYDAVEIGAVRGDTPKALVSAAVEAANELAAIITSRSLFSNIQGKRYVKCEGWTTLAAIMGCLPREVEVTEKDGTYVAIVELHRIRDDALMGRASAECGMAEPTWKSRAPYARRSMAVTRATSKACRIAFSWVMTLAGFEVTPAEEIPQEERPSTARGAAHDDAAKPEMNRATGTPTGHSGTAPAPFPVPLDSAPLPRPAPAPSGATTISRDIAKDLFALAGKDEHIWNQVRDHFGFTASTDLPVAKLDEARAFITRLVQDARSEAVDEALIESDRDALLSADGPSLIGQPVVSALKSPKEMRQVCNSERLKKNLPHDAYAQIIAIATDGQFTDIKKVEDVDHFTHILTGIQKWKP